MLSRTTIAWAFLCALILAGGLEASAQSGPRIPPLIWTTARQYVPTAWRQGGERFPMGALLVLTDDKGRHPLAPEFVATADANVSFDAKHALFSGKRRPLDRWQIWEVSIESGAARQITQCREDCVRPLYVPNDRVVYAHKRNGKFAIEIAPLAGGPDKSLQLTYGPGNSLPSDILRDGRVLFETANPLGGNAPLELYTVYTDGSGVESYRCDHGAARHNGKQLSSGDIVFARDKGLGRFTSALAHEAQVPAPSGSYAGDVAELPDGNWLVSWRRGLQAVFELRQWKRSTTTLQLVAAEVGQNIVQPVLVVPRPVPNRHPSGLHEWSYANLLCLNAYTSKYQFPDNAIVSVRVYTRNTSGMPRVLGSAPVEKDGSFYLRLPGDQPLKLELLDKAGKTLKKEAGWFWLRQGEQRACVGCHAGPETSPENAVPAVLLRSTVPADMTTITQHRPSGGH